MKKLILIIFLILNISISANEKDSLYIPKYETQNLLKSQEFFCDACGCGAGNGSSGFESLLNPQFIGIKYFSQHYKAKENLFTNELTQDQYFNTIQIWGKIPITEKLSVYGSLPFQFHEKKTLQGDIRINGIGDASLMGIYQILNSKNTFHQLNGGFGVKIPIGKFDERGISGVNPSFQLGTGSWDYQLALNYKFQKNLFALLINTDYTLKTENKKHYQFGNQWNYAMTGFQRIWRNENSIISGKLGLQGEVYDWNKQFGEVMPRTAGSALYGKIGFEASYKKWSIGSEVMLPAYTNLASGDIEAKSRFGLFVNFGI
ncbi:transporter [Epilithonimonas xixisoli]|uniref:Outer membrane putative beta-barrel porin/alpha-amylase n=1 Tax=Epilithonimonas xixisoli TaxID=1476462 RepID=A0A4R8I5F1_9FLAO|nr:transporter [Epilithonimonas xixisoli]TDX84127.1 outer membrane putative beta-barrel porin/alpha-amylase [Epilithonimonas xixisoli]